MFESVNFPGWEVVRKIGEGSFGGVYEIQRKLPDGRVETAALKKMSIPRDQEEVYVLQSQSFSGEQITAYFKKQMEELVREYLFMQKLSGCPNVVSCQDVRYSPHEDGIGWDIYIRMELLTPLKKYVTGQYSEYQVLRLGLDMCRALAACEKQNIIHRDIKPQNILVSENRTYKLADFGIAKVSEKTESGTMAGTNGYIAPEVANRQKYGKEVDIYSLGMVLYWLMNDNTLALPEDILHESNRPIAQRAAAEEKPPKSDIPPAKRKPIVPLVVCGILGICILAGGLLWLNRKHASPEPAAMTEALQEQTETAAEPEETTAPGSTTEETLPAATEAESTAAVLLSNVDCTYEIAEDGITITGISGQTPSEVILPEELENLPVTRIGNGAFQSNTSLKKVTLPSGILVIGEKAFSGCTRLQSISFPDGLSEISASAFENCSNLSSVLLPESVHAIGPWAFSNCKKLLSITIPGSASDLGEWAFSGCSSLSELTFSPGITTISNYLFYNCQGLKAVTIPDGVITIGIGAFSGCTALSEVTLPESMRTLSSEAFQGTALESISVPSACSLGSNAVPLGCKIYSTR